MRKKKVCFFSTEGLSSIRKQQYSLQDINILNELGFEVIIASRFDEVPFNCDLYFSWWASGSIIPLIKALISNKPTIVIAGGNEAMLYKDSITSQTQGYLAASIFKKIATRITLKLASKVLTVSAFMLNDVKTLGSSNPILVHNSVNTELFKFDESIAPEFVTSVFNLNKFPYFLKRGEIFIKSIPMVLAKFPNQKFVIIGQLGDETQNVKNLIASLGIGENVILAGTTENSLMVEMLQKSKVYVQISDTETFGLTVAEAMSCQIPVVISNRGALPELAGNLGIYVDHNSSKSVSEGIVNALSLSTVDKKKLGSDLRERIVQNYSYPLRKQKIEQIINEILNPI